MIYWKDDSQFQLLLRKWINWCNEPGSIKTVRWSWHWRIHLKAIPCWRKALEMSIFIQWCIKVHILVDLIIDAMKQKLNTDKEIVHSGTVAFMWKIRNWKMWSNAVGSTIRFILQNMSFVIFSYHYNNGKSQQENEILSRLIF